MRSLHAVITKKNETCFGQVSMSVKGAFHLDNFILARIYNFFNLRGGPMGGSCEGGTCGGYPSTYSPCLSFKQIFITSYFVSFGGPE
jgi:hypothetical protein